MVASKKVPRRQWRDYRTAAGGRPVKDFLDQLADAEVVVFVAAVKAVVDAGPRGA